MTSSYYLWQWADNELPGSPNEVFAELLRGRLHPALQIFDAQPILQKLQATAEKRHTVGEEWNWQVQPADDAGHARFIFLQSPTIPRYGLFREEFSRLAFTWSLSGYDENRGSLIRYLPPKLNWFELGGFPEEEQFDIVEDDLPMLLGHIHPAQKYPWGQLTSRENHYVACYARCDRFDVEWRENRSPSDFTDYDHWRAGYGQPWNPNDKPRMIRERRVINSETFTVSIHHFQHEKMRFSDTVQIFRSFLRGEPRPTQYHWRSLREEEEQAKQQQRKAVFHD